MATSKQKNVEQGEPATRMLLSYPMKKRGRVIIIENIEFENEPGKFREGSDKDREALVNFYKELKFDIVLKQNLKAEEMENEIKKEITDEKGWKEDCFILFVLSHGSDSIICGTDNKTMHYSVIFEAFEHTIWENKPKLIYIQASRHRNSEFLNNQDCYENDRVGVSSYICEGGDVYAMFATIRGEAAFTSRDNGSRLIESLIAVYREYCDKEDVETMGIRVKNEIYKRPYSTNLQRAMNYSSLNKRVFLKNVDERK